MIPSPYDIGKDAIKGYLYLRNTYRRKKLKKVQEAFQSKDRMAFFTEFLRWKYNNKNILRRRGQLYPVAIFPAPEEQRRDLESVLHNPLSKQISTDFIIYNESYKQVSQGLGILGEPLINRQTYVMKYLRDNSNLQLECQLGTYFDALDTCDALEWEILLKVHATKKLDISEKNFSAFNNKLKLRKRLHEKVSDPVVNGTGRSAAIAISTLITYNDGEKFNLLVRKRSETGVAVHAGLFHVVPSFMFQPLAGDLEFEFSIIHNIFREYLEEVFDIPEEFRALSPDYFYENPNMKFLKNLLDSKEAEIFFTGVAVNLLNLRPEICTLLLIRSPEWYKLHSRGGIGKMGKTDLIRFNREFVSYTEVREKVEDFILKLELTKNDRELMDSFPIYPYKTVPSGAAAFWLGFDMLGEILNP